MTGWTRRVRRVSGPQELQQIREAAQDIAAQSGHAPGRARVVFTTVADCALIGTAVLSGALAAIHLYRALFTRPREDRDGPSPTSAGRGREPPHRRGSPTDAAADDYERGRSPGARR